MYYARFVDKAGKRHDKYFQKLPEARNWIEEAKYADKHDDVFAATETTVDEWLNFGIENFVGDLAPNAFRNYRERYGHNIRPVMGSMMIANVKPVRASDDINLLACDEQRVFLETAGHFHNYNPYEMILETGLRTGEMIGLTWKRSILRNGRLR